MKVVLMPGLADDRAVKLAHQDVEDKYTVPQLIVVLLKVHVEHMELWLADRAAVVEALCLESLEHRNFYLTSVNHNYMIDGWI